MPFFVKSCDICLLRFVFSFSILLWENLVWEEACFSQNWPWFYSFCYPVSLLGKADWKHTLRTFQKTLKLFLVLRESDPTHVVWDNSCFQHKRNYSRCTSIAGESRRSLFPAGVFFKALWAYYLQEKTEKNGNEILLDVWNVGLVSKCTRYQDPRYHWICTVGDIGIQSSFHSLISTKQVLEPTWKYGNKIEIANYERKWLTLYLWFFPPLPPDLYLLMLLAKVFFNS